MVLPTLASFILIKKLLVCKNGPTPIKLTFGTEQVMKYTIIKQYQLVIIGSYFLIMYIL